MDFLNKVDWFSFFVGGIFVSFLVNIAASFTYPRIQQRLDNLSKNMQYRSRVRGRRIDDEVKRLLANAQEEIITRQKLDFFYIKSCIAFIGFVAVTFFTLQVSFLIEISGHRLLLRAFFLLVCLIFTTIWLAYSRYFITISVILSIVDMIKNRPTKTSDFNKPYDSSENKKAPSE